MLVKQISRKSQGSVTRFYVTSNCHIKVQPYHGLNIGLESERSGHHTSLNRSGDDLKSLAVAFLSVFRSQVPNLYIIWSKYLMNYYFKHSQDTLIGLRNRNPNLLYPTLAELQNCLGKYKTAYIFSIVMCCPNKLSVMTVHLHCGM